MRKKLEHLRNNFCRLSLTYWKILWETGILVWVSKLWRPKNNFQVFFFRLYFFKKYVEVAINDFTMYLIISKWLKMQKCRHKRKKMRQRCWSERRNCQQKCFHSFNYVIGPTSILLGKLVDTASCDSFCTSCCIF